MFTPLMPCAVRGAHASRDAREVALRRTRLRYRWCAVSSATHLPSAPPPCPRRGTESMLFILFLEPLLPLCPPARQRCVFMSSARLRMCAGRKRHRECAPLSASYHATTRVGVRRVSVFSMVARGRRWRRRSARCASAARGRRAGVASCRRRPEPPGVQQAWHENEP